MVTAKQAARESADNRPAAVNRQLETINFAVKVHAKAGEYACSAPEGITLFPETKQALVNLGYTLDQNTISWSDK